jgi:hypothetical protein
MDEFETGERLSQRIEVSGLKVEGSVLALEPDV